MIQDQTTVLIAYVAVRDNPLLVSHASHFVDSYRCHPPGYPHTLAVVCNGGELPAKTRAIFDKVPAHMIHRANDGGWDVSAYIDVANHMPRTLQVCLGESVYFHREGWLSRLVDCYQKYGAGMYGFFSSFLIRPHLNTTAFAVSPDYLTRYPVPKDKRSRYDFEHGDKSLWRRIVADGGQARLVTWDGFWEPKDWRKPPDILWRGDQSNCLMACNHLDRYFAASASTKQRWAHNADTLAP